MAQGWFFLRTSNRTLVFRDSYRSQTAFNEAVEECVSLFGMQGPVVPCARQPIVDHLGTIKDEEDRLAAHEQPR